MILYKINYSEPKFKYIQCLLIYVLIKLCCAEIFFGELDINKKYLISINTIKGSSLMAKQSRSNTLKILLEWDMKLETEIK